MFRTTLGDLQRLSQGSIPPLLTKNQGVVWQISLWDFSVRAYCRALQTEPVTEV